MTRRRDIDGLTTVLGQIRARLAMLKASSPPELRDNELRKRIAEVKVEEEVALAKLAELGVKASSMIPRHVTNPDFFA